MKKVLFSIFVISNLICQVYSASFDELFELEKSIVLEKNHEVSNMTHLIVDANKNFVFLDYHAHNVFIFSQDGKFIKMLGNRGKGPGEFESPLSAATDTEGRLFICDNGLRKMSIFNADYKFLKSFFIVGNHFMPDNFTVLSNNNIIMAGYYENFSKPCTGNNLELYSPKGKLIKSFEPVAETASGNALAYYSESELDIDSKGNIYSIQATNPEILRYSMHGDLLSQIQLELSNYKKPEAFPDDFYDISGEERKKHLKAYPLVRTIYILNDRYIVLNIETFGSIKKIKSKYFLEILDTNGKSKFNSIETDYRLLCKHNDYLYFLTFTDELDTYDIPTYKIGKFKVKMQGALND